MDSSYHGLLTLSHRLGRHPESFHPESRVKITLSSLTKQLFPSDISGQLGRKMPTLYCPRVDRQERRTKKTLKPARRTAKQRALESRCTKNNPQVRSNSPIFVRAVGARPPPLQTGTANADQTFEQLHVNIFRIDLCPEHFQQFIQTTRIGQTTFPPITKTGPLERVQTQQRKHRCMRVVHVIFVFLCSTYNTKHQSEKQMQCGAH